MHIIKLYGLLQDMSMRFATLVIISTKDFYNFEKNYMLLLEAAKRLAANEGKSAISETDVMKRLYNRVHNLFIFNLKKLHAGIIV